MAMPVSVRTPDTQTVLAGTNVLSTTAEALGTGIVQGVWIRAATANAGVHVLVGDATSQPYELESTHPGIYLKVADLSKVYVKGASGTPTVNWIAEV